MKKELLTKESLEKMYSVDLMNKRQIARLVGCNVCTLYRYFEKFKIKKAKRHGKIHNLKDNKFYRLKVLEFDGFDKHNKAKWKCQCDCGEIKSINGASLIRGLTKSCGCIVFEKNFTGYKDISGCYFKKMKKGAAIRNLTFEITIEDIWEVYEKQGKKCYYTGLPISFYYNSANKPEKQTASVDRIDSKLGYTKDNIQIVHKCINQMKQIFTDVEFISFCNLIALNHKKSYEDCMDNIYRTLIQKC